VAPRGRPILVAALDIARELCPAVPVLRCRPGLKRPWGVAEDHPDWGKWDVCNDPEWAGSSWLKPEDNLAVLLGESKLSPIIGVGLDCYKTASVMDRARELGVTFQGNTWSQRTGRGGYTIFYLYNGPDLKRDTAGCDGALDLLVSGYSLIAPSNTEREPQGGGPYEWMAGHSPLDIPLAALDEPPEDLLLWWQSLSSSKISSPQRQQPEKSRHPEWLTAAIPEGQRNQRLTQIAGYWHRQLPDNVAVRLLVHQANSSQCAPPMRQEEVNGILDSILRREGAGSYRGVVPSGRLEVVR
jgi:hypothetical protein